MSSTLTLIGGEYDVDSLDILLIITNIEKEFGIEVPDKKIGREVFTNVGTLADFVEAQNLTPGVS